MPSSPINVAILGSTGSIGTSALEVIEASAGRLRATALSAHCKTALALEQAIRHRPRWLIITDESAAARQDWSRLPKETELLIGHTALEEVAACGATEVFQRTTGVLDSQAKCYAGTASPSYLKGDETAGVATAYPGIAADGGELASSVTSEGDIDVVLAAIVGSAGLRSTWSAVAAGRRVAIANKETLVMAGPLVMELAAQTGAVVLPVDSEHSAVFQCLQAGRREELKRVILTASGGPFRQHSREAIERVTIEEALKHPNWNMGPKITIDSATMMNKALEIIEARWLFDLRPDQIDVVVHPQSIVHSMVEFIDGSVVAQLSPPDMKLPIQYAICYPERCSGPAARLDLSQSMSLDFEPPDEDRFPALRLGREAAFAGGTAGAVLNAANEAAVECFLAGELPFSQIVPVCRRTIEEHDFEAHPNLDRLVSLDRWARAEVLRWVRN